MLKVLLSLFGLVINLVCVYSSSIYTSINWDPQNPFFTAKSQSCSSGYMTLKVHLQSKIHFICPNTATVLEETLTQAQTFTMYENLWIVYNRTVFEECDTTLEKASTSKELLKCVTPTHLSYFSVVFAEHTAVPGGLTFKGGKKYYFIGTSDGTQTHINNKKGGHCNDSENGIFMKIEVYVCKKSNLTYTDDECLKDVGVLKCKDNPTPTTTLPTTVLSTRTTQAPSSQAQTATPMDGNKSGQTTVSGETTGSKSNQTPTELANNSSQQSQKAMQLGDNCLEKEKWKSFAIALLAICFLLIVVICFICYMHGRKENLPDKKVRHQSVGEKNPASRQESVGGVSNRGFDDDKAAPNPNSFLFYEVKNENSSISSTEEDGRKPTQNGGIFIENKLVHFATDRKTNDGIEPAQDGNIVFEKKEVHYAKDGKNKEIVV